MEDELAVAKINVVEFAEDDMTEETVVALIFS